MSRNRLSMGERAVGPAASSGTLPEYDEESENRTRQSEAQQADVNWILDRAVKTGLLPQVAEGFYGDVSGVGDYREALERVSKANKAFMSLDAKIRSAFSNDPAEFLDAFQSPEGVAKLQELGVLAPSEASQQDAREAAAEERAIVRAAARAKAARVKAAESEKPPV